MMNLLDQIRFVLVSGKDAGRVPVDGIYMNENTRADLTFVARQAWRDSHRRRKDEKEFGVPIDNEPEPEGEVTSVYGLEIIIDNQLEDRRFRFREVARVSDLTIYEQCEVSSDRAVEFNQALVRIQQQLPFVTHLSVIPARTEIVDGQEVQLNAYVKFSFDNDRHLSIAFPGNMPNIVRHEQFAALRDTVQKEYDAQNAGERPFRIPPA